MAELVLRGICKSFGATQVLHDIDLAVASGEFVVIVGPSGCGKSTILRLIAGLEDAESGELEIDGVRVNDSPPAARGVAMVFQSYALYPHMSAFDNMAFGLRRAALGRTGVGERVRRAADLLQINPLLDRKPSELSGGQRQRVAIGRAIVREPKLFLFDEPLSNLDADLRGEVRVELRRLHEDIGATTLYVTHDQVEAMTLADRIVALRDGRIEQVGSPLELYDAPANRFVAGFIGTPKMSFLEADVAEAGPTGVRVGLAGAVLTVPADPSALRAGTPVTLGMRPERLVLDGNDLDAEVVAAEPLGGETYLHLRLADGQVLTARTDGRVAAARGARLSVGIPPDACHLFDSEGRAISRLLVAESQ